VSWVIRQRLRTGLKTWSYPVIVYIPSAFDFDLVRKVKDVIKKIMREFDVEKPIFFKPDIFSVNDIYSGRSDIRPYIFVA
jgi:hypothetical protein